MGSQKIAVKVTFYTNRCTCNIFYKRVKESTSIQCVFSIQACSGKPMFSPLVKSFFY